MIAVIDEFQNHSNKYKGLKYKQQATPSKPVRTS